MILKQKNSQIQKDNMSLDKKIAFIFSRFPSISETYLSREINGLMKKGMPIIIFSLKNKKWEKIQSDALEIEQKIQVIRCGYLFSMRVVMSNIYFILTNPKKYFQALISVIKNSVKGGWITFIKNLILFPKSVYYAYKIKKENITHIHAMHATYPTLTAYIIKILTKIPYSFAGHATDIYADTTMLGEKIKGSSFMITCTGENVKYLSKCFRETVNKDIFLSYHGIKLDIFQFIEKRDFSNLKILSVGRIEKLKGHIYLIEACRLLKQCNNNFQTIIIGQGSLMNQIKDKIKKYGLEDNVIITGALPYDEVIEYYRNSNIFVLPAIRKYQFGIPNVLIEAMATGLPVITTRLSVVENELIVDKTNGILVNEKSPQEIIEAIKYLSCNTVARKEIIFNARKTVEDKFDFNKNIEKLYNIFYENIIY